MTIVDPGGQYDAQWLGVQVAVKSINAAGGIKGRPIEVSRCGTNLSQQGAATCARQAASDQNVVAMVGDESAFQDAIEPSLITAKLPEIGTEAYDQAAASSPVTFCGTPGLVGTFAAAVMLSKNLDKKKIATPYVNIAAGAALPPLIDSLVKPFGGSVVSKPPVDPTTTDVSAQVAAMKSAGANGVVPVVGSDQVQLIIKTSAQQGYTTPTFAIGSSNAGNITQDSTKYPQLHFATPSFFNRSSDGWKAFIADVQKYAPSGTVTADNLATGWFDTQLLKYALDNTSDISRAGLLSTMNAASSVDIQGMTPVLDFTKKATGLGGAFPRLINTNYYPYNVVNGQLVSINNNQPVPAY